MRPAHVAARLDAAYPATNRGWGVTVVSLRDALVGEVQTPLLILFAAVVAVLLIACANVMSLMLARGVTRAREMAVRAAVGASTGRLVRQQMAESLSSRYWVAGGSCPRVVGTARASGGGGVALPCSNASPSTGASSGRAGHVCGVGGHRRPPPRMEGVAAVRRRRARRRRRATGHHAGPARPSSRAIALATLLVAGGGVAAQPRSADVGAAGFTANKTLLLDVTLPSTRYKRVTRAPFFDRALERIRALPGIQAAGAGGPLPLSGLDGLMRFGMVIEGEAPSADRPDRVYLRWATPDYFSAMGIALRSGRQFARGDIASAPPIAVIDEGLARRFFGSENPIGRRI